MTQPKDPLIGKLETAFGKLMKELDQEHPLDQKVKVFNAGIALAKVKHAISEKEGGEDFNPDYDAER